MDANYLWRKIREIHEKKSVIKMSITWRSDDLEWFLVL